MAAAIGRVRGSTALEAAKLAFELLVLTVARWGEVRWAEWEEIDRSGGVWTIPARRMKTNRQHRVPLCGRALEILEEAEALGEGAGPLVFTHRGGQASRRPSAAVDGARAWDCGCAARFPLQLSGLGG